MTGPDHCPELKTFTTRPTNTHGYVEMKGTKPVVNRGERIPPEGSHKRCAAALANRTFDGVPVLEDVVTHFCERIQTQCPILSGANRLY